MLENQRYVFCYNLKCAKMGTDIRRLVSPHFHLRCRSVPVFRIDGRDVLGKSVGSEISSGSRVSQDRDPVQLHHGMTVLLPSRHPGTVLARISVLREKQGHEENYQSLFSLSLSRERSEPLKMLFPGFLQRSAGPRF